MQSDIRSAGINNLSELKEYNGRSIIETLVEHCEDQMALMDGMTAEKDL